MRLRNALSTFLTLLLTFSVLAQQTVPALAQETPSPTTSGPSAPPPPHTLLDGTPIKPYAPRTHPPLKMLDSYMLPLSSYFARFILTRD